MGGSYDVTMHAIDNVPIKAWDLCVFMSGLY